MHPTVSHWFELCYQSLLGTPQAPWLQTLPQQMADWYRHSRHGEFDKWVRLLNKLPVIAPSSIAYTDTLTIVPESNQSVSTHTQKQIEGLLKQFMPWRKGPFNIHGVHVDTEWRSDWKWQRVAPFISDLTDRTVLDVGCGSGYHMWRMLGDGAKAAYGIDPTDLFFIQFQAIKHFYPQNNIHLLPLGIENMQPLQSFDTVFSMGVLYHRKDPLTFLHQLRQQLRRGGELVLETLVVDGDEHTVMLAGERYAQMRNVWFLPSTKALEMWLSRLGFVDIKTVDVATTSIQEQRTTEWMTNHSLQDFLDPNDPSKTIEGAPAPVRAVIVATKA